MPIKMVAVGRYYDKEARKEYGPGQEFEVTDQKRADRLVLRRRAKIATEAMRAETKAPRRAAPQRAPAMAHKTEDEAPRADGSGRYSRRDMRSED